jgi:hypothetical protein
MGILHGTATALKRSLPTSLCGKVQIICRICRTYNAVILLTDKKTFCHLTHYLNDKLKNNTGTLVRQRTIPT